MSVIDPFVARVGQLFQASGDHLIWTRLGDGQVWNIVSGRHERSGQSGGLIEAEQAYFTVRLTEMFLGRSRTLWRKYYPVVHAFCGYADAQQHALAGPGQLQTVTDSGLDRVVTLNFRLAGPTPFRGGDVSVVAGLYSVPGDDAAKALVETVSAIAGLAVLQASPAGQVAQITQVIKNGIDSIFQLNTTKIRLGINDTMIGSQPLRSGYYVGIGATAADVDFSRLWLVDGHLVEGRDPVAGRPFVGYDYMVIQLERTERLANWPALPGMTDQQQRFNAVLGDDLASPHEKSERLNRLWPGFKEALRVSPYLTKADARAIANDVQADLQGRLTAQRSGNPFESKSWGSEAIEATSAAEMDFAEIPESGRTDEPAAAPF
jgi:hypothetical protein